MCVFVRLHEYVCTCVSLYDYVRLNGLNENI